MIFDIGSWSSLFNKVLNDLMEWLPSLFGALLLMLAGWLAAYLLRVILQGILRRLGVDTLIEKTGVSRAMHSWGIQMTASRLIARIAYWLVILLFFFAASESLGLNFAAEMSHSFTAYLPRIIGALLIVLIGSFLASMLSEAFGSFATKSGQQSGPFVAELVKYTSLIFVMIIAIQKLGVETTLLSSIVIILLSALALSLAIAFGLGTRELAKNIIAGFHSRESFVPGTRIVVRGHSGKLLRVGTYKFMVETEAGKVSLPNHILTDEEITIVNDEQRE